MNFTIKNEENIHGKKYRIILITFSLLILIATTSNDGKNMISIFAQFEEEEKDSSVKKSASEDKNNNNNNDLTTITVQIDKNNIINNENNTNNNDNLLKIVGYLNGEGQTNYVDLKEIDKEMNLNDKFLKVDLKFNKSNDISSTMVDDEYYVCAYVMKDSNRTKDVTASSTIPFYDCDEGNIGKSTTNDIVTLFSTMKKYSESKIYYTTNQNKAAAVKSSPNEVKITINVPVYDAKDIDDMNVVAMVKGEYKIKTVDVQKALKNGDIKDGIIPIPFTFERQTEIGLIQPGDLFFGCATSDEFPNQNSDCEKRMLKDLSMVNGVCARKDSSC
jgi:hypothetical protein